MSLPPEKAIHDSLGRNSFWLLIARLTAQGLALVFAAIIARRLGVDDFGHFAFIAALVLIGNTFTNFGTDTLLIRETAQTGHVTHLASRALFLQLILSFLFWIFLLLYTDPPLTLYSLSLFPLTLYSVATALLRALDRMDLFWALSLANGLIQVVSALFSFNLWTLCAFLLTGQFIFAAFAVGVCSASLADFKLFPLKDFRPLFKLTFPFAALTILLVLMQRLGIISISIFLDDTSTGLFSSVTRVVDGLKFGHYAILGALLPAISRGAPRSWTGFRKGFLALMGLSLLMATGLAYLSRLLIIILYGEGFLSAGNLLSVLGWSLLPYTISSFISYDLIARGLEYTLLKAVLVSIVIHMGLYLWLINSLGLSGAVWAALAGECLQAVVFLMFAGKRNGLIELSSEAHKDDFLQRG